jgi:hypothetical protein
VLLTSAQQCTDAMSPAVLVSVSCPTMCCCVCCAMCVFPAGLDSFAALSVMGHLQHVAQATYQTVIATIHQPRSAIWEMFDMVRDADHLAPCLSTLSLPNYLVPVSRWLHDLQIPVSRAAMLPHRPGATSGYAVIDLTHTHPTPPTPLEISTIPPWCAIACRSACWHLGA